MNLNKDPERWRRVSVAAVMDGSRAQCENVLRMAIEDILRLADAYELAIRDQRERDYVAEMQRDPKLD